MLARECIRLGLADDLQIALLPIILGDGVPVVHDLGRDVLLRLKCVTAYRNGLVELWYDLRRGEPSR